MANDKTQKHAPVLDPIERVSEVVFGVLMATASTGALSIATAGSQEIRTMMIAALGCNLAWGLTDAVMYLISTVTERRRKITLLQQLQATEDVGAAQRLIADALPDWLAAGATPPALEAIRKQLLAVRAPTSVLGAQDYAGAFGVIALVILSTFPVVIPFLFIDEAVLALRISNLLAATTLFFGGLILGHYAGGNPWRYGLAIATIGGVLVGIIIALGG